MRIAGILLGTILTVFAGYALLYSTGQDRNRQQAVIQLDGNKLVQAPILESDVSEFPDDGLVDQEGDPVRIEDLKGRRTLISFIYTSCPDAKMCPLITKKMKQVQQQVNPRHSDDVQFVSVTFDPETDTPETLTHYGEQKKVDFQNWSFWTGPENTIDALVDRFKVTAKQNADNDTITHNMRTYILDHDLIVQHAWRGSRWSVDEVAQALKPEQTDG